MATKVAINGFGRIGRCLARILLDDKDFELVAINCSYGANNIAYLLKYDSVHGRLNKKINIIDESKIEIDGKIINIIAQREVEKMNFIDFNTEIVFECTGAFLTKEKTQAFIDSGIKKVIFSAPAKDDTAMFVMDVNHTTYNNENIVSNASCTTNALAPLVKVLDDNFKIQSALMNTIHAYTASQAIVDTNDKKDLRRGRAAALNLVPTSTGAARAIAKVLPHLKGKIDGQSIRTGFANVSMVDLTVKLSTKVTKEQINEAFIKASENMPILGIDYDKCVSSDFITSTQGSVFIPDLTQVVNDDFIKILAWYDNEYGYSYQLKRLAKHIIKASK